MSAPQASSRFDWSLGRHYDYIDQLIYRDWGWEWMRRHPEFQMAWWRSRDAFEIVFSDSKLTVLNARADASFLERWGCVYTDAPNIDARLASVFWRASYLPAVLPMQAFPASTRINSATLVLCELPYRMTVLVMPDGVQQVLLRGGDRCIQLAVAGASVLEPVHLLARFVFGSTDCCRQIETLCQLNNLIAGVPSSSIVNEHASRLGQVLQALDGSLAGASHREIAIALFGIERVEADWNDPRQNMRDRVRRAVNRGRYFMNGGYRQFLR